MYPQKNQPRMWEAELSENLIWAVRYSDLVTSYTEVTALAGVGAEGRAQQEASPRH